MAYPPSASACGFAGRPYILTANTQLARPPATCVHLWDGSKYHGEIVAQEPKL